MLRRVTGPASLRRPAAWHLCLALALVATPLYYWLNSLGPGMTSVQVAVYCSANLSAAAGATVAAFRHRWLRLPMLLIAAGSLCCVAGDLITQLLAVEYGVAPYPSLADVFSLSSFPLLGAGFLVMIRRRTPGRDSASLIDAAIVAVSATFLAYVLVIVPTITGTAIGLEWLASVGYPVGDLVLIAFGGRLLLGGGPRTASLRLFGLYLFAVLGADAVFSVQILNGTFVPNGPLDAVWMFSGFALGAAALHPSVAQRDEREAATTPDATWGRLAVLAGAAMLAPTVLLVQQHRNESLHLVLTVLTCNVLFLLVMTRMAGLVRAQRQVAIKDALTGLHNRRFFEHHLRAEADRGDTMGVLLLDIDHFKRINDGYGHHGGDRVLVEVAQRMRTLVRPGDLVARYGGEEFTVLLPGASPQETLAIAERIRHGIADTPIPVGDGREHPVTVSVGACDVATGHADTAGLLRAADHALYAAKSAGRNRVSVAA